MCNVAPKVKGLNFFLFVFNRLAVNMKEKPKSSHKKQESTFSTLWMRWLR